MQRPAWNSRGYRPVQGDVIVHRVPFAELERELDGVLALIDAGETVIVTRDGRDSVKMVPITNGKSGTNDINRGGEVTYLLTQADYVDAQKAAFSRSVRSWPAFRLWLICTVFCGAIGGILAFGQLRFGDKVIAVGFMTLLGAVALPLCWGLCYLLLARRASRLYRQQRALSLPWTYRWSEAGLENEGATGTTRYAWDELHAWKRTQSTLLFYANDILFHMLPTRVLSATQVDDITTLLAAYGPKRR